MAPNNRQSQSGTAATTGSAGSTLSDQLKKEEVSKVVEEVAQEAKIDQTIQTMLDKQEDHLKVLQALYGDVECSATDGAVSERFGKRSCAAMEVIVPLAGYGIKLVCALYANRVDSPNGTQIIFSGYVPARVIKFMADDPGAKERLVSHIEIGAFNWPGYEKATASAEARLMGIKPAAAAGAAARPNLVRLVKHVSASAPVTPAA